MIVLEENILEILKDKFQLKYNIIHTKKYMQAISPGLWPGPRYQGGLCRHPSVCGLTIYTPGNGIVCTCHPKYSPGMPWFVHTCHPEGKG